MQQIARFIPKNVTATVRAKGFEAVVYLYQSASGKIGACGYFGKAQKPSLHYVYRTEERRAESVTEWLNGCRLTVEARQKRQKEKREFVHSLKVGTVLRTSWGYDQTNVEYFEVTRLIGEKMVEVREIAQESETTHYMQGKCVPVPGKYIGEPMRKRVLVGNSLDIHGGFGYAYVVEPKEVAPGVKVYEASHWSSYA